MRYKNRSRATSADKCEADITQFFQRVTTVLNIDFLAVT